MKLYLTTSVICLLCLVSLLASQMANAQISINGLEEQPELKAYLQNTAIEPANQAEDDAGDQAELIARTKLKKALKAQGYFRAAVTFDPDERSFAIVPGALYRYAAVSVAGYSPATFVSSLTGGAATAHSVYDMQSRIHKELAESCFYTFDITHQAFIDHTKHTVAIKYTVNTGEKVSFGETTFEGAPSLNRTYLNRFITYKEGECWDSKQMEETKAKLLTTGLMTSIETALPEEPGESGKIDVTYKINKRGERSVRAGLIYSTFESFGVVASWRHRNVMGSGETLGFGTHLSAITQTLNASYEKPFFLSDKQSFTLQAAIEQRDTDAFEESSFLIEPSISRALTPNWSMHVGNTLDVLEITEDGDTELFGLYSVPMQLDFDNRNDVLNPREGHLLTLSTEPFFDVLGTSDPFWKSRVTTTAYVDSTIETYAPLLALRVSVGTIWGAETSSIPASKRFYAGGGGSIRGFGYQQAGPAKNGEPVGGRSIVETNAELRLSFTENIGGVAFMDAGGVYDTLYPNFTEEYYLGAGVGMRYYTGFGPLRFDIAIPLNQDENTSDPFQLYFSIGQSF